MSHTRKNITFYDFFIRQPWFKRKKIEKIGINFAMKIKMCNFAVANMLVKVTKE